MTEYRARYDVLITELWAENFKSFGKRATVPLSKFTLLIGANNAGKSNVLDICRLLQGSSWPGVVRVGRKRAAAGAKNDAGILEAQVTSDGELVATHSGDATALRESLSRFGVWSLNPARIAPRCGTATTGAAPVPSS